MTINEALDYGTATLAELEEGQLLARLILQFILNQPTTFLFLHHYFSLSKDQEQQYRSLIIRASHHEPLAYLTGTVEFYGRKFKVDQRVLIPRPETEDLVAATLSHLRDPQFQVPAPTIIDVGTGSGCIAITLAKELPQARVLATDISELALEVARENARLLEAPEIEFIVGSLLESLPNNCQPHSIDVIVANLPYISDVEFPDLPPTVRDFEPSIALHSGAEPDELNRQLVTQSKQWLKPTGMLIYETTNGQMVKILPAVI